MQQFIFVIFFIGALYCLYKGVKENNLFFTFLSMAFNLGLGAGLLVDGIHFLNQINSGGYLVYVAQTAANNPFINGLAYLHLVLGLFSIYWALRHLNESGWKLSLS